MTVEYKSSTTVKCCYASPGTDERCVGEKTPGRLYTVTHHMDVLLSVCDFFYFLKLFLCLSRVCQEEMKQAGLIQSYSGMIVAVTNRCVQWDEMRFGDAFIRRIKH